MTDTINPPNDHPQAPVTEGTTSPRRYNMKPWPGDVPTMTSAAVFTMLADYWNSDFRHGYLDFDEEPTALSCRLTEANVAWHCGRAVRQVIEAGLRLHKEHKTFTQNDVP